MRPTTAILLLALAGHLTGCGDRSQAPSVVSGTVTHRERMALPPDAAVTVELIEASRGDSDAQVIADTTLPLEGRQVPLPFKLVYDPERIDSGRRHALRATVRSGGQVLFATDSAQPVLGDVDLAPVELRLERVGPAESYHGIGTEPFWAFDLDSVGLHFETPEDSLVIPWSRLTRTSSGDTSRWTGETGRAAVDARLWRSECSDGMSDRTWAFRLVLTVNDTTYRGCADPA